MIKVDGLNRVELDYGPLVGVDAVPGSQYNGHGVGDELIPEGHPVVLVY